MSKRQDARDQFFHLVARARYNLKNDRSGPILALVTKQLAHYDCPPSVVVLCRQHSTSRRAARGSPRPTAPRGKLGGVQRRKATERECLWGLE